MLVTVSPANSRLINRERLVGAPAPRGGVDATRLDLVAILTTHADAEREAARGQLGERGDLTGDGQRMPQRQEVDGSAHTDCPGQRSEGGGLHQPVEALPALERDVVPDAELVDAGRFRTLDNGSQIGRSGIEQLAWGAEPDANRRARSSWVSGVEHGDHLDRACDLGIIFS